MAGITHYTIGFPPDWYRWEVGTGAQVVDDIAARAADSEEARALVRRGVLGLDEECTSGDGMFLAAALWIPDRTSGGSYAVARLELLVNDGVPSIDDHVRLASKPRVPRGVKVIDRVVQTIDVPAGPVLTVSTTLAQATGGIFSRARETRLVETRVEATLFPPGSTETLCLHAVTVDQSVAERLGEDVRAVLESLTVEVGQVPA